MIELIDANVAVGIYLPKNNFPKLPRFNDIVKNIITVTDTDIKIKGISLNPKSYILVECEGPVLFGDNLGRVIIDKDEIVNIILLSKNDELRIMSLEEFLNNFTVI